MTRHAGNLHIGAAFLIDLHLIWPLKPVKPPMGWLEAKTHTLTHTHKCMHIQTARSRNLCQRNRHRKREKEGKNVKKKERERNKEKNAGEKRVIDCGDRNGDRNRQRDNGR